MLVAVLCCAATGEAPPDARLVEAQQAFDEATRLQKAGKHADAIQQSEHALMLREAVLGAMHPAVADSLHQLGNLFLWKWELAHADPHLHRALAIREAALGPNHPDVARSLSSLAHLYHEQGFYSRAEPLHERALAIREAALGPSHPDVADSLIDLAMAYCQRGLCIRAEPLYERALAIQEAAHGPYHPDIVRALGCLAVSYSSRGFHEQARVLHERVVAIQEAALGKDSPSLAISLNNLASAYIDQGLYAQAESLSRRAITILEARRKDHINLVFGLGNLAKIYQQQGLYARAESMRLRALAIWESALGPHHPDVALPLKRLANLYYEQGRYARAEPLYERALAIREAALGQHHPSLADTLQSLAQLHLAQRRLDSAVPLLTHAFAISEQSLREQTLDSAESRLMRLLQSLRTEEELLYSMLRAHPDDTRVQRLALTSVLLRKGRSVEEIADTSRAIYRSLGAQDRETFERLRALRTQLAQVSLSGPGLLPLADYQQRLKSLTDQGDALEADLARRSAPLRALTALPPPGEIVDRVASTLPTGGALIELIAYDDRPLVPKPGTSRSQTPSRPRYLALVLFSDARIRTVDLGPAVPIDRAALGLRDALARRDSRYQRSSQKLYSLAFQPLLPLLGGVHRLFIAPDGQLGLVPFAALHDGRGFLVDSFDISYLTSGKELLPREQGIPPGNSVVVLADPALDDAPTAAPATSRFLSRGRRFPAARTGSAEQAWTPLPGTRQEAEAIQRLLPQAQLFLGAEATKQRLLELAAPGVLHLATHGFSLEDAGAPVEGARAVAHFGALGGGALEQRPPDPLLRSGLVLSGAHAARAESSLVTALELAGLDLWGTQLVVLSACDTGRGDVKLGQGVYGLRRAFVVAGAETVVMSLWKVDDDSTRALMEQYYRHLLAGRGRAEALRDAMRTLRKTRPHPHHWAPFIALGQDTPLRSGVLAPRSHAGLYPLPHHASPEPR